MIDEPVPAEVIEANKAYRIDDDTLRTVRQAFDAYMGTFNYWNYTIQKRFNDKSAMRHIKMFTVRNRYFFPFMVTV
jgi:tRNA pseudouridine38-40 synthase